MNEGESTYTQSKKRRFSSSRDFYEPPDDYYEHLPLNISLEDLERRLRFPPVAVIPTAPRAMLAAAAASAALASQTAALQANASDEGTQYYANTTESAATGRWNQQSRTQAALHATEVYPTLKDPLGYENLRSGTAVPTDDSALPTGPAAMQGYSALSRPQSSRYSSPVTDNPSQPAAFTSTVTPSTEHIKLPPNWKAALSPEGNMYYYNSVTNQSQWEPPEGKVSSIEGVDQSQLDGLVASAIMEAERKKKLAVTTSETDSKRPSKASKSQSSAASKTDNGVKPMSEVELKKEVGKRLLYSRMNGTAMLMLSFF